MASHQAQEEKEAIELRAGRMLPLDLNTFLSEYQQEKATLDERLRKLETENNTFRLTLSRFEELLNSSILTRAKKFPEFTSEIRVTFESKKDARTYENKVIKTFRKIYGERTLPGNKGEH